VDSYETSNAAELLIFTDKAQVYKGRVSDFEDTKASALGEYLPQKYDFDKDEKVVYTAVIKDYSGYMLFFFRNGKAARVPLSAYETKTNRKKLINAYSDASPLVAAFCMNTEAEFVLMASNDRCLIASSASIAPKTTKNTIGVNVLTLKSKNVLSSVELFREGMFEEPGHYRTKNIPAAGCFVRKADSERLVPTLF